MIYDPAAAVEPALRLLEKVETEIVPGVGHLLGMQQPELVNARIRTFLDHPRSSGLDLEVT